MNNTEQVKKWVQELIGKMGVPLTSIDAEQDAGLIIIRVISEDGGSLIGQNGDNLNALNHLLRRYTEKNSGEASSKFVIDVNGFRKKSEERVKGVAQMLGERALTFKSEVAMEPAGSFERRVVHSLFQEHPHLMTESRGFGKDRHVIIKFVEDKMSLPQVSGESDNE